MDLLLGGHGEDAEVGGLGLGLRLGREAAVLRVLRRDPADPRLVLSNVGHSVEMRRIEGSSRRNATNEAHYADDSIDKAKARTS